MLSIRLESEVEYILYNIGRGEAFDQTLESASTMFICEYLSNWKYIYGIPYTIEPSDGVYTSLATTDIYTSTSHVDSQICNTSICVIGGSEL